MYQTVSRDQFDREDKRNIWRHPENVRNQRSNDVELNESVNNKGVMWFVRSECWVLRAKCVDDGYLAIAAGSITNAFYACWEKMSESGSENKMLIATRKAGVPCRILHEDTPFEIRMFLRDWHNRFHRGSGFSFLEALTTCLDTIEPAWQNHKEQLNITCRSTIDNMSVPQYAFAWVQRNYPGQLQQ